MKITLTIPDDQINAIIPEDRDLRCFPQDRDIHDNIEWLSKKLGESFSWFEEDITTQIINEVKTRALQRKRGNYANI